MATPYPFATRWLTRAVRAVGFSPRAKKTPSECVGRWVQRLLPIPRSSGGSSFGERVSVAGALVGVVREDFDGTGRSFWSVSRSLTKPHRILSPAGLSVLVFRCLSRRVSTSFVVTEANLTVLNLNPRLIFRNRHASQSRTKRWCLRYVRPRLCNLW